jgi:hypothetical protein
MLYRVENLSKTGDKRLADLAGPERTRGVVGEIESLSDILGSNYDGLFFLFSENGDCLGIYREEELEEVTEKQLQLETDLGALLSIFPNKVPQMALDIETTDVADNVLVDMVVPVLRKRYKKEFANQTRIIKNFLANIGLS